MSLRTAPCPRCQALIVFGERQCRTCAMPFDYGPNPPPEPSAAAVFDVLMSVELPPMPSQPSQPTTSPASPGYVSSLPSSSGPVVANTGMLAGLDTGRQAAVGDVDVEEIPGFIDSTLFAAYSPKDVDVATMPGLELTQQADVQVKTTMLSDIDGAPVPVGDVATAPVPGLFGSDLFRADVDIAAGASASPALEVTMNSRPTKKATELPRVSCPSCATVHAQARCPSCGTAAPSTG